MTIDHIFTSPHGRDIMFMFFLCLCVAAFIVCIVARFLKNRPFSFGIFKGFAPGMGHLACPKHGDFVFVSMRQSRYTKDFFSVSNPVSILSEQKRFAREIALHVAAKADSMFRDFLSNSGEENIANSPVYSAFQRHCEHVRKYVLDQFSDACEENHLADKSELEFHEYLELKSKNIADDAKAYSFRVTPEALYQREGYLHTMSVIYTDIQDGVQRALKNARDVSIRRFKRVDELLAECEADVQKIISGGHYGNQSHQKAE